MSLASATFLSQGLFPLWSYCHCQEIRGREISILGMGGDEDRAEIVGSDLTG